MTTWVLLRGLAREARHWGDVGDGLAARLGAGHQVLALDLPGNGSLCAQQSPASVAELAARCRAELGRQALPGPYVLVAMSLGAMVALEWAHAHPENLAGCVLLNTSLRGLSPFWRRLRPRSQLRLLRVLWPGQTLLQREALVLAMTSSQPARHAGLPARWAGFARQHPVRRGNVLRQLLAAARYRPPAECPRVPMLVLSSRGDALVSPACSQALARHWQLPHAVHPTAGHDLPLDAPSWVLAQITGWWAGRHP